MDLIQDFSLGEGGGGGGGGGDISIRQHFRTRHWDLNCMFWSMLHMFVFWYFGIVPNTSC